jgi:hypothetical protein
MEKTAHYRASHSCTVYHLGDKVREGECKQQTQRKYKMHIIFWLENIGEPQRYIIFSLLLGLAGDIFQDTSKLSKFCIYSYLTISIIYTNFPDFTTTKTQGDLSKSPIS